MWSAMNLVIAIVVLMAASTGHQVPLVLGKEPRVAFRVFGEESVSMLGPLKPFAEVVEVVLVCTLELSHRGVLEERGVCNS